MFIVLLPSGAVSVPNIKTTKKKKKKKKTNKRRRRERRKKEITKKTINLTFPSGSFMKRQASRQ
jgi:hypothetical protein